MVHAAQGRLVPATDHLGGTRQTVTGCLKVFRSVFMRFSHFRATIRMQWNLEPAPAASERAHV
jgi:hypothetical protein